MTAEDERVRVLDRDAELLRDERPEARRVEHARHPEHALAREAGRLQGDVAHRVERVGDDDQDRVRGMLGRLLHDGADDARVLGQQVITAHPGLTSEAGGDDHDVRVCGVGVVVGARDPGVVPDDRRRLGQVERLALREPLDDVDQDHVGQACLGDPLCGRRADIAGPDDGDLVASHAEWSSFRVFGSRPL